MITMRPVSGRRFRLDAPDPADVSIEEIALSLSRINRFLGNTRAPYTVAEHCVRVSRLLEQHSAEHEMPLRGLLHDAAEAYTGDITAPMKAIIRKQTYALDVAEERIERAILTAFGLRHMRSDPPLPLSECERIASVIKWADLTLLATEQRDHQDVAIETLTATALPKRLPYPLTAEAAERAYLERFEELSRGMG